MRPHVALLQTREERVEVGHVAELLHYPAVVADVITVVGVGRVEVRAEPDDVDTKLLQVVEPRGNARQVADPVSI